MAVRAALGLALVAGLSAACDKPGIVRLPGAEVGPDTGSTCSVNSTALEYPARVLLDVEEAIGLVPAGRAAYRTRWGAECPRLSVSQADFLSADCQAGFPWLGELTPPVGSVQLDLTVDVAPNRLRETVMYFAELDATERVVRLGPTDCGGTVLGQQREYTLYQLDDDPAEVLVATSPRVMVYLELPPGLSPQQRADLIQSALVRADGLRDPVVVDELLS